MPPLSIKLPAIFVCLLLIILPRSSCSETTKFKVSPTDVKLIMTVEGQEFEWPLNLESRMGEIMNQEDNICKLVSARLGGGEDRVIECRQEFRKEVERLTRLIEAQNLTFEDDGINDYVWMEEGLVQVREVGGVGGERRRIWERSCSGLGTCTIRRTWAIRRCMGRWERYSFTC